MFDVEVGILFCGGELMFFGWCVVVLLYLLFEYVFVFVSKDVLIEVVWLKLVVEESNFMV